MIKVVILIFLIISISVVSLYYFDPLGKMEEENKINEYQGPVPEGYDESYFRETGITKPLKNN